ncbi:MAG: FG-GAP repeat protein [Spirochaetales bacterium]|nr:FG-GAP repeat protein [Spirochaetales bacterium]
MNQKNNNYALPISIIIFIIFSLFSCIPAFITFNLTILHQGNGTTNPNGEITINEDEALTITALPDENGIFENWEVLSGSGCRIDNVNNAVTTVTLTSGNAVIQANFTAVMEGNFVINNDNSNTLTESVILQINITGATEMRFGNTPEELNTASWETYAENKAWDLTPGIAIKTVYGEFRDNDAHKYGTSDTIRLIKKIVASDGYRENRFGRSVAISSDGSTVVVGAFDNASGPGAVYVYRGTNWSIEKKITASDGAENNRFGFSVAISSDGSTIVVGDYYDDDNGEYSGSIYIYDGTNWGAETKITPSDGFTNDQFGICVATSADGSTIVAGAHGDDDNDSLSGSVYVYHGTDWSIEKKITANDGAEGDRFGFSVAISADGSTIVAGAYDDDNNNGDSSGSVYVYNGLNWSIETKITPSDGTAGDNFGVQAAISSDGSTIITGARYKNDNGSDSGSIYIYTGSYWETETKITPSDGSEGDLFGNRVAISSDGSTVVVGAYNNNNLTSGSVYFYKGSNWSIETKITPSDGIAGDYFSWSVAVSSDGSTAVVGALGDNVDGNSNAGSAYVIPLE